MGALRACLFVAVILTGVAGAQWARADDRHAGYYYPEPQSREVYKARATTLAEANRSFRLGFVTGFTNQMLHRPFPPTFAMFLKGNEAEKMIIVALEDGRIDTIYRARAIFANMTAIARLLPAFIEMGVQEEYTFFDLAKMMGIQQITISDGIDFAHQVMIE